MKIVILNGNPGAENKFFDAYLDDLSRGLEAGHHKARILTLRDMKIHHCIGCFDCWYKTPGVCIFKDDMTFVCREYINSDFVIFASPIIMGFTSSLLKKAQDRLIPLGQPYGNIRSGKLVHVKRYFQYPSIGLLLDYESNTDSVEIEIIRNIYKDISICFFSKLKFVDFAGVPVLDITNEIDNC